jgi:hypothetical protein
MQKYMGTVIFPCKLNNNRNKQFYRLKHHHLTARITWCIQEVWNAGSTYSQTLQANNLHSVPANVTPSLCLSVKLLTFLTFWRRIFFQILAHPVFKMWVIQKLNKVALWNKRHFEEEKWRLYSMFKIFSADTCWVNIIKN